MIYTLIKLFKYDDMPNAIKVYFDKFYRKKDSIISEFNLNTLTGKVKDKYNGKKIICKWTFGKDNKTFIIEREDNVLLDWLIDNGLDIKNDNLIIIKH
jgi:hypothetical protein